MRATFEIESEVDPRPEIAAECGLAAVAVFRAGCFIGAALRNAASNTPLKWAPALKSALQLVSHAHTNALVPMPKLCLHVAGLPAALLAAASSDPEALEAALAARSATPGAEPGVAGLTPLHVAVLGLPSNRHDSRTVNVIETLAAARVDVNARDDTGRMALHYAASLPPEVSPTSSKVQCAPSLIVALVPGRAS